MDGNRDGGPSTAPDDEDTAETVPHVALSGLRGRPPTKVFVSKPFSSRSLMQGKPATSSLLDRLHGKGPIVKWPTAAKIGHAPTPPSPASSSSPTPPAVREPTMSERFISERLLSDRGSANYNPQIPRRVPDIPSPASVKANEADSEGKRLVIGRAVRLSGEIAGCERLVVEGQVEATLNAVKALEVGSQGTFKGTAAVETALVAGAFEGTLTVSGHLEIGPSATVKGTVSYGTIAIASGGKLLGTIVSAEPATQDAVPGEAAG